MLDFFKGALGFTISVTSKVRSFVRNVSEKVARVGMAIAREWPAAKPAVAAVDSSLKHLLGWLDEFDTILRKTLLTLSQGPVTRDPVRPHLSIQREDI